VAAVRLPDAEVLGAMRTGAGGNLVGLARRGAGGLLGLAVGAAMGGGGSLGVRVVAGGGDTVVGRWRSGGGWCGGRMQRGACGMARCGTATALAGVKYAGFGGTAGSRFKGSVQDRLNGAVETVLSLAHGPRDLYGMV
jgi:hypothetical protein